MIALTVGVGHIERVISDAGGLLCQYREDIGLITWITNSILPANKILPEDLAVTLLMNSRVGWRAFQSLQEKGHIQALILPFFLISHLNKPQTKSANRLQQ